MTLFLSKFLPLFLYPAGMITLLLVLTLLLWKKRRLAKTLLALALIVLLVGGNKYVAQSMAYSIESMYPPLPAGATADVIVLLGGGTEPNSPPRSTVELNSAGDRVTYTYKLYRDDAAPLLLLSGGSIDFLSDSSATPAENMAGLLTMLGVPESALILQNQSENTEQDALFSCRIIKERGFEEVILVTSAWHMPRSVALFEAQGCRVIPAPADYSITESSWQSLLNPSPEEFLINLVPQHSNLSTVSKVMKELIGMAYYHLSGVLK